jgi:hypothetical protein
MQYAFISLIIRLSSFLYPCEQGRKEQYYWLTTDTDKQKEIRS